MSAENTSVISRGADELAYKRIEPYLSDYMGAVFEDISNQHLWNEDGFKNIFLMFSFIDKPSSS